MSRDRILRGALAASLLLSAASANAQSICPEAKGHEEWQGDWLLAKGCTALVDMAWDGVKSKLTSLAKGALASAINSFLPGIGSALFGLGGGGDPFAAHAQRIIDEIHAATSEINDNVAFQIDEAVSVLMERTNRRDIALFSALVERVEMWNHMEPGTKLESAQYIQTLNDDFKKLRNLMASEILFRFDNAATPPYDTMRMLHYYILVVDLEFEVAAAAVYWPALTFEYRKDVSRSHAQIAAAYDASPSAQASAQEVRRLWRVLFDHANGVAQAIGATDALFENTIWHSPVLDPDQSPGERTPAVEEGETHWPPTIQAEDRASLGWADANWVEYRWFDQQYLMFVGRKVDRFCSTRLFSLEEMAYWEEVDQDDPNAPVYVYGKPGNEFFTTDPYIGLFEHGPRPFCAPTPSSVPNFPDEWLPYWDPTPQELFHDPNILAAIREVHADHARQSSEYASTFSTGYAPLRVALDKWWRNLRSVGETSAPSRPYNAADSEYDDLLWHESASVRRTVGVTPDVSLGMLVDNVFAHTDHRSPTAATRSKVVGFGLEYGVDALIGIVNQAFALDQDHVVQDGLWRYYPWALMEAYIDRFAGTGVSLEDYYSSHVDEVADPSIHYSAFRLQTGSGLHQVGEDFAFAYASNGDLFAIKKSGTGSGTTEVHVLSAASNYQQFSLQTGTALHQVGDDFEFALGPNRDLFAIKKSGTGSGTTEVHVLSAASNYGSFSLQTGTGLHQTGANTTFEVAENGDLFIIIKNATGSGMTEVHVLSAASNYQQFSVHAASGLHATDDTFDFVLAPNRDVIAIKKSHTSSGRTEVHVLSAASNYGSFSLQTGTALHETDATFSFLLAPNRDLVAIKERNTGSGSSEVHVLSH